MNTKDPLVYKDRKLLYVFGFLIVLISVIGVVGIAEIQDVSRRIESLGKHNLRLEKAIREMQISATVYAAEIRNQAYWRISRYLGVLPSETSFKGPESAIARFALFLSSYRLNSYAPQQRDLAGKAEASFKTLVAFGQKIVAVVKNDEQSGVGTTVKSLLMAFDSQLSGTNKILDAMGGENLKEITVQLDDAEAERRRGVFSLLVILLAAITTGSLIAFSVYRKRIKERLYRHQLLTRMMEIEENERTKLSQEIHDQMGQDLSALRISLGLIEQEMGPQNPAAAGRIVKSKELISQLLDKSHSIAYLLRPPALDEVGLSESIEEMLLDYKHLSGIHYVFNYQEGLVLPPEYSLLCFRICQELLTNMIKHSGARNVALRLSKDGGQIVLYYEDDGKGFMPDEIDNIHRRRKEDKFKLGLRGLKERVELLDGTMTLQSFSGKGVKINVVLTV
jgi:signal transduction histidine kinase